MKTDSDFPDEPTTRDDLAVLKNPTQPPKEKICCWLCLGDRGPAEIEIRKVWFCKTCSEMILKVMV